MFIEKGFTVKESKECGASGTMALLTMARYTFLISLESNLYLQIYFSPDEALMALAVMHNYAPEQYKVTCSSKFLIINPSLYIFSSRILPGSVSPSVLRSNKKIKIEE